MNLAEIIFYIIAIIVLIAISAFFSGTETAMTAASKTRFTIWGKNGNKRANVVLSLLGNSEKLIGSLLIGNNFVNILSSVIATKLFIAIFGDSGIIITTIVMTAVVVIFAEVLPKVYALSNANKIALKTSFFIRKVVFILTPLNLATMVIVNAILKLFRASKTDANSSVEKEEELRGAIELHTGDDPDYKHEREMLRSVMDLDDTNIEDAITHRNNVETIDINHSIESIIKQVLISPYSRFPVMDGLENVVGVIDDKSILNSHYKNKLTKRRLKKHIMTPLFVPESGSMLDQLQLFRELGKSLAIVIDEYGSYMGVITMEDILIQIVGNLKDETSAEHYQKTKAGSYTLDGSELIKNINRELNWNISDVSASTIAGYLIYETRSIPMVGQKFLLGGYECIIQERKNLQITQVEIKKI